MKVVTIASQSQVVIPKRLPDALKISPCRKSHRVIGGDRIEVIPLVDISKMKGRLKGTGISVERKGGIDDERH